MSIIWAARLRAFYKGKPSTTMTTTRVGRRAARTTAALHAQRSSSRTDTSSTTTAARPTRPSCGASRLSMRSSMGQPDRAPLEARTRTTARSSGAAGRAPSVPNAGPVAIGTFRYRLERHSGAIRERANQGDEQSGARRPRALSLSLPRRGRLLRAPLGGCRMARLGRTSASVTTAARRTKRGPLLHGQLSADPDVAWLSTLR